MAAIQNVFRNHKQSSKSLDDENVTSRTKRTATKRRSPVLFRPKMRNNSFFRSCLGPKQNFFSGKLSKKSRLVAASDGTKAVFSTLVSIQGNVFFLCRSLFVSFPLFFRQAQKLLIYPIEDQVALKPYLVVPLLLLLLPAAGSFTCLASL